MIRIQPNSGAQKTSILNRTITMNWLHKLRHALGITTTTPVAPAEQKAERLPLAQVLQQEVLTQLPAHFGSLQVAVREEQIYLESHELALDTQVMERTLHPPTNERPQIVVLALGFRLRHEQFFPEGMAECLVGIGEDEAEAMQKGVLILVVKESASGEAENC